MAWYEAVLYHFVASCFLSLLLIVVQDIVFVGFNPGIKSGTAGVSHRHRTRVYEKHA
jgi:hypothetical protein